MQVTKCMDCGHGPFDLGADGNVKCPECGWAGIELGEPSEFDRDVPQMTPASIQLVAAWTAAASEQEADALDVGLAIGAMTARGVNGAPDAEMKAAFMTAIKAGINDGEKAAAKAREHEAKIARVEGKTVH